MSARVYTNLRVWRHQRTDASGLSATPMGGIEGMVATPHGYVDVYSGPRMFMSVPRGKLLGPTTRLRFISNGRQYVLSYSRMLTRRGAARIATRFARDVVEGRIS